MKGGAPERVEEIDVVRMILALIWAAAAVVGAPGADLSGDRSAQALAAAGALAGREGRLEDAVAAFSEALRFGPDAKVFLNRGVALERLGRHRLAAEDFTSALRLRPDDADAYRGRGVARDEVGDYSGAVADYSEALRLQPRNAETLFDRAAAYEHWRRYRAASADYQAALQIDPELSPAAQALKRLGQRRP